jgi:hypothetical protein
MSDLFVSVYNGQQHFAYRRSDGTILDAWYDGHRFQLQQINLGGAGGVVPVDRRSFVMTGGPAAVGDLFVTVYNDQQHFTYLDVNHNIQDAWYDNVDGWRLQQINNTGDRGPTVNTPEYAEPIAWPEAIVGAVGGLFVCPYNNQHHFAYLDANGHIQDVWYDGQWHWQQINLGGAGGVVPVDRRGFVMTGGPAAVGDLFVTVYNDQQHFTYRDINENIQDSWYDADGWRLQQINNTDGRGPTVNTPEYTEPIANQDATAGAQPGLFVCPYNDQHHFAYLDTYQNIQDVWYDGHQWHLQQVAGNDVLSVPGEFDAMNGPIAIGGLFVTVYNDQQHFAYLYTNPYLNPPRLGSIQDAWYDSYSWWNLQQINGTDPVVDGEYVLPLNAPDAAGDLFVSVYNNQQHFTYLDTNGSIQDAWYDGQWHLQQIPY